MEKLTGMVKGLKVSKEVVAVGIGTAAGLAAGLAGQTIKVKKGFKTVETVNKKAIAVGAATAGLAVVIGNKMKQAKEVVEAAEEFM